MANKRRRVNQRNKNLLQGMMFLPDGRALIMDNELFKRTIDQSIILDILETENSEANSPSNQNAIEFLQPTQ